MTTLLQRFPSAHMLFFCWPHTSLIHTWMYTGWVMSRSPRNRLQNSAHVIYDLWARQDICFCIPLLKDVLVSEYHFLPSNCFFSLRAELGYDFSCLKPLDVCFASFLICLQDSRPTWCKAVVLNCAHLYFQTWTPQAPKRILLIPSALHIASAFRICHKAISVGWSSS